jgi:hypothetical protein
MMPFRSTDYYNLHLALIPAKPFPTERAETCAMFATTQIFDFPDWPDCATVAVAVTLPGDSKGT